MLPVLREDVVFEVVPIFLLPSACVFNRPTATQIRFESLGWDRGGALASNKGYTAAHSGAHGRFLFPGEVAVVGSNHSSLSVSTGWCRGCCRSTSYPACECRLCFRLR